MRFAPAIPFVILMVTGVAWIGVSQRGDRKQKAPTPDPSALAAQAAREAQERRAHDAGNISVEPAKAQRFDTVLESVARQAKVAIIAEGTPRHLFLPPDKAPVVDKLNTAAAIRAIASAFDYAVEQNESNGKWFLLRKQYSDPRDVPNLTVSECVSSLEAIEKGLRLFDPRVPSVPHKQVWETLLDNLAVTLKPEQLEAMKDEGTERERMLNKGMPITALSPDQQKHVRRLLLYAHVQEPATKVRELLDRVRVLPQSTLQRRKFAHSEHLEPSVVQAWRDGSGSEHFQVVGTGGQFRYSVTAPDSPKTGPVKMDSVIIPDTGGVRIPTAPAQPGGVYSSTLGQALARIQTLEKKTAGGAAGRKAAIAPELEGHAVTLAGDLAHIRTSDLLDSAKRLYGGVIQDTPGKALRLTVQRPPLPKDVFDLSRYMYECIPQALRNACQLAPQSANAGSGRLFPPGNPSSVFMRTMAMQGVATEHLLATMKARGAPPQRVAFKDLSLEDQSAFVVALVGTLPKELNYPGGHRERVPAELAHFDELYLKGGKYKDEKGKPKFGMEWKLTSPEGQIVRGIGGSNWREPLKLHPEAQIPPQILRSMKLKSEGG